MTLSTVSERAIQRMVDRWELHGPLSYCLPVPITQVARTEGWVVRYIEDIFPLYGFAVVGRNKRMIGVNAEVARPFQRTAIAHEMGHVINGDADTLHFCSECHWLHGISEERAHIVAGRLLIPDAALTEISSVSEIAALCDVPVDLVELRIADAQGAL